LSNTGNRIGDIRRFMSLPKKVTSKPHPNTSSDSSQRAVSVVLGSPIKKKGKATSKSKGKRFWVGRFELRTVRLGPRRPQNKLWAFLLVSNRST
jgi:hypothetical protein